MDLRVVFRFPASLILVSVAACAQDRSREVPASPARAPLPVPAAATEDLHVEASARALLDKLVHKDFAGAVATFDARMTGALPPDKLGATWEKIVEQAGAFGEVATVKETRSGDQHVVLLTCRFAKASLDMKVVIDPRDRITGLFFAPTDSTVTWTPPAYAHAERFTERKATVGTSPALSGTLTVPKGAGPFPAVVLVHGTGPNDADESIGGAKVFKDLAWGLASEGVAVLRYVKRSRVAPVGIVTEKEEVLDAAHAAVALCRSTPEIDPARVFVVGHSQGGGLGPRLAQEGPGIAGLVVMAGNSRPLQDLVVEQTRYLLALTPGDPAAKKRLDDALAFKVRVEDPALAPDDELSLLGSSPIKAAYFLAMRSYKPAEVAAKLGIPILVLQGDRDYQVTTPDLEGWQRALASKKNATIKRYAGLNHLFIAGTGRSTPEEYALPGHVDEEVVRDIAAFVVRGSP